MGCPPPPAGRPVQRNGAMEMTSGLSRIQVEVAFASAEAEFLEALEVAPGATAMDALNASGFFAAFPDYASLPKGIGIFGEVVSPQTPLKAGDRVEVYRPLQVDPKEARRRRAEKKARLKAARQGR